MLVRNPVSRQIAEDIERRIAEGSYAQGEALPSMGLIAKAYSVSIPTLRESLRSLERSGLVRIEHGRGVFVGNLEILNPGSVAAMVNAKRMRMRAVYEARIVLETGALALGIKRVDDATLGHMRAQIGIIASPDSSVEARSAAEMEFHLVLVRSMANPLLMRMEEDLLGIMKKDLDKSMADIEGREETLASHSGILAALESRDLALVTDLLTSHLMHCADAAERLSGSTILEEQ